MHVHEKFNEFPGNLCILGDFHWRRQWHPTPVLLPGKSHGWRSLVGCNLWVHYELDTTEQLHFHFSLSHIGEVNGNPLQCSCLENPRDWGAWWAAIYGVVQNRTQLKWLSSSSSKGLTWSDIKFLLLQFSLWIILLSSSGDIIHVLSFPYPQIPRSIFMGITAFAKVLKSC